jgi:hypothetical protein
MTHVEILNCAAVPTEVELNCEAKWLTLSELESAGMTTFVKKAVKVLKNSFSNKAKKPKSQKSVKDYFTSKN